LNFRDVNANGIADVLELNPDPMTAGPQASNDLKLTWAVNYLSALLDYYQDYHGHLKIQMKELMLKNILPSAHLP
jgi:hypothetical protein